MFLESNFARPLWLVLSLKCGLVWMFYSVNSFCFKTRFIMNLSELEIFNINFGEVALAWNTVRVSCVRILFGYFEVFFIKALEMLSDWARVFFLSFIGIMIRSHVLLLLFCKWYSWFCFFCINVVLSVFEENLRFWVRAPSLIGFIVRFFFLLGSLEFIWGFARIMVS